MKKIERKPAAILDPSKWGYLSNKEVADLLNKVNEEYYYWDKVKHQPVPPDINIKDFWGLVKLRRQSTSNKIKFGKYHFYWNINNNIQECLHYLDMNIGGTLEASSIITKDDKNRYLVSSIMEEAIASSQIEGAVTTRKVAKEMLRKQEKPKNKSEQMIFNNYATIQMILDLKGEPLTKQNLLSVHQHITAGTIHVNEEGFFRRADDEINIIDNETGRIVYKPPDEKELEGLLTDLFLFFNSNDDKLFIHPLIKASIIHFIIGFIHPFTDGNGRTARALFYWYLIKEGYWLTEYLSISRLILRSKAQYARAFQYTELDDNDLTYFILYNLRTTKLAFEELRLYIQRKQEEKLHLSALVGAGGLTYKQALILEWFDKEPSLLLTIKETENRLAISNEHARKNLLELAKKGFVELLNIDKKTRAFKRGKNYEELLRKPPKGRLF